MTEQIKETIEKEVSGTFKKFFKTRSAKVAVVVATGAGLYILGRVQGTNLGRSMGYVEGYAEGAREIADMIADLRHSLEK